MKIERQEGWQKAVAAHWQKTTGYLVASSQPCFRIRDEGLAAVRGNRLLVALDEAALAAWTPPASWLMAVLLCPGDSTAPVAAWVAKHGAEPGRVHFYLHPRTAWTSLEPWHLAGFPTPNVDDDVGSWGRLHKLFGLALNDRIVADWG